MGVPGLGKTSNLHAQGVLVTLAIGLHNIPEGLAVSTVLVARGISPRSALLWTLFTALPQPLVAVPAFLFVDTFMVGHISIDSNVRGGAIPWLLCPLVPVRRP